MTTTLAARVDALAASRPEDTAFIEVSNSEHRLSWGDYAERSRAIAASLAELGLARGDRVAVLMPDGPDVHAAFGGVERAGLVTVGIGPRAGEAETRHLIGKTGATALLSVARHRELDLAQLAADEGMHHVLFEQAAAHSPQGGAADARPLAVDELWLLNSTSGTTGLPKCVTHTQARWNYFHELASEAGEFDGDDVFLSAIPAPFGFGIWTAHFTPTLLGVPCVVCERFDPAQTLRAIAGAAPTPTPQQRAVTLRALAR